MSKITKKIITKTLAGFIFAKFFGPIGITIGWLIGDYIEEFGKKQIEEFTTELFKQTGEGLVESDNSIKDFFKKITGSESAFEIDSSLTSILCKVWEERIRKSIETKNFTGDSQSEVKLLEKFQNKLKEAQRGKSSVAFYEIFPKGDATDFQIELDSFEKITDQEESEKHLWNILQKTFAKWTDESEKETFKFLEKELQAALTEDLQSDFLVQLKANENFRRTFQTTFEFYITERIKKQGEGIEEIKEILKPSVDYDSAELKQEALTYLQKVAEDAMDIKTYFPEHLQNKSAEETPFDIIRQRVSVTEKKNWDEIKARIEEQSKLRGVSTFEDGKTAHKYRLTTGSDTEISSDTKIRIFDWDNKASKEFKRVIFLGDPGFGKTWLLCFEARKIALDSKKKLENGEVLLKNVALPIRLRLSTLAEYASDDLLARTLAVSAKVRGELEPFSKNFEEYIYERIKNQENVIILLDALDEVPENPQNGIGKEKLRTKLEKFSSEYPKILIYLTSRIVGYDTLNIKDAKELELLPFQDEQIKRFTKVWFHKDKVKDEKFHELLENQPQTAGLAQIPLMLSLLCKLFDEQTAEKTFPETRSEIYHRCLIGLLREWKKENERQSINDIELNFRLRFLKKLAFKLFEKQYEQFDETSFTQILCETLGVSADDFSAEEKVIEWRNRLEQDGIIKKAVKGENPEYLFLHLTFQEYLTASYLAQIPDWKEYVFRDKILFNPRWQEVLTLLGGTLTSDKVKNYIETLLEKNGENDEHDILGRPGKLAMFAAAEAKNLLPQDYKILLWEICIKIFFDGYINEPYLTNFGEDIIDYLLVKLEEKYHLIKSEEEYVFVEFGEEYTYLEPQEEPKFSVNFWQIYDLLRNLQRKGLNNPRVTSKFVEYIKNEETPVHLRKRFSYDIVEQKKFTLESISDLIGILKNEKEDLGVRSNVGKTIENQENLSQEVILGLVELLLDESSDKILEETVIRIIENQKNLTPDCFFRFIELLEDIENESLLQKTFASAINSQRNLSQAIISWIIEFLKRKKTNPFLYQTLAEALINQDEISQEVVYELIELFKNENENQYLRWLYILGITRQENLENEVLAWLIELLKRKEESPYLMQEISRSFVRQRNLDQNTISWFINILRNEKENEKLCWAVAIAVESQPTLNQKDVFELFEILKEKKYHRSIRESAAFAIGKFTSLPSEKVEELVEILKDKKENHSVRIAIADRIIKQQNLSPPLMATLIKILKDIEESWDLRKRLADTFSNLSLDREAIAELIEIIKENIDDLNIRISVSNAVSSLVNLSPETIYWFIELLKGGESNESIRNAIAGAIANQRNLSKEIVGKLFELLFENKILTNVNVNIITALSVNVTEPEDAKKIISMLRDDLINKKTGYLNVDSLIHLVNKFMCAVPWRGKIVIDEFKNQKGK